MRNPLRPSGYFIERIPEQNIPAVRRTANRFGIFSVATGTFCTVLAVDLMIESGNIDAGSIALTASTIGIAASGAAFLSFEKGLEMKQNQHNIS